MSVASPSPSQPISSPTRVDTLVLAKRGIELCRNERWQDGYKALAAVAQLGDRQVELPEAYYSYLGYLVARFQHKVPLGLALARHAAGRHFFEPDNFLNLARIHLLAGDKRKAYRSVVKGLRLDSSHVELRRLLTHLGRRRRPVVRFLARSNPVNLVLGRIRHQFVP